MAKILADKDIRSLIGSALVGADTNLLNPNGIELRLGKHVLFYSTGEEKELSPGSFLQVFPGESVAISSIEYIDSTKEKVQSIFPGCTLMALITPTTTMMREGISQVTTKIDVGFRGILNWGLRNGSINEVTLEYGEPIFKLTFFLLDRDESPEVVYGERPKDAYQDTHGIIRSRRRIPADIPKSKIVSSGFDRLDHKKRLQEAGYPFDHIGTELTNLHGKFEVVSSDVRMMKEEFQQRSKELTAKIDTETNTLPAKIEQTPANVLEKVEALFDKKFIRVGASIIGGLSVLYGGIIFLQGTSLGAETIGFVATIVGIAIVVIAYWLTKKQ